MMRIFLAFWAKEALKKTQGEPQTLTNVLLKEEQRKE